MGGQDKNSVQASGSTDAPKKNNIYAIRSRGEQETSPDVVTGMLKCSVDVYSLLYLGATLYFVTTLVSKKFDFLPDILNEPLIVYTPVVE